MSTTSTTAHQRGQQARQIVNKGVGGLGKLGAFGGCLLVILFLLVCIFMMFATGGIVGLFTTAGGSYAGSEITQRMSMSAVFAVLLLMSAPLAALALKSLFGVKNARQSWLGFVVSILMAGLMTWGVSLIPMSSPRWGQIAMIGLFVLMIGGLLQIFLDEKFLPRLRTFTQLGWVLLAGALIVSVATWWDSRPSGPTGGNTPIQHQFSSSANFAFVLENGKTIVLDVEDPRYNLDPDNKYDVVWDNPAFGCMEVLFAGRLVCTDCAEKRGECKYRQDSAKTVLFRPLHRGDVVHVSGIITARR